MGLPGTERVFDDANVDRILRGHSFIDAIPMKYRREMVDKGITRLVKGDNGARFETIDSAGDVIKLAGRGGALDLAAEFGVPAERVPALDVVTQLAIGAGIDALRDAGIPLVLRYKTTTKGTKLPERWMLPEALRDETGVIFGSAFPGYDALIKDVERDHEGRALRARIADMESLRARLGPTTDAALRREIDHRLHQLRADLERGNHAFDRRFLFRILAMGHSQFAEYIGARGPNTQVNAACASGTLAVAIAQDWIREGRCKRVVCITADNVTGDGLMSWIGAGFLASGAAATDELVEDAAIPFDRRRHGLLLGMGAAALVVEASDTVRARGLRPICQVLGTTIVNSAFHGSRLDVEHIGEVMERLVADVEARWGLDRRAIAETLVFMSHETYTPARGGSAQAEVNALRHVFGDAADDIVVANTKGYTGHAMGAGIEDTVAVKILETGIVPPVANFKEIDPDLGRLNLSRGGAYPVRYALRLGAGFGSQLAMSLLRWVPSADGERVEPDALGYAYRIVEPDTWARWLRDISGQGSPEIEIVRRTLRVRDAGAPKPVAEAAPISVAPVSVSIREPVPVPPPAAPATAGPDPIEQRVLAIVAAQTGYPPDMLDLDLDLEADLGIDTVKQAETFAAVREAYDMPRDENLQLREFPTLAHVAGWVRSARPDLAIAPVPTAPVPTAPVPTAPVPTAPAPIATDDDGVEARVLGIVADQTGYPPDMLGLDLDLEADLGIDTVKQAETFAAVREAYDLPRDENLQLREFPTLGHLIGWVRSQLRSQRGPVEAPPAPAVDDIEATVLGILAAQTGYPPDMLGLDLDLEADLGVDTVKQAETFAAVREAYEIPREENLQLREFPTLGHVIAWVRSHRVAATPIAESPAVVAAPAPIDTVPRRVPVPVIRPALDMCRPTGVELGRGQRVLMMKDANDYGRALVKRLDKRGVEILLVDDAPDAETLVRRIEGWRVSGPIHGVYWLAGLDDVPSWPTIDSDRWREALRVRVKLLYTTMRALYDDAPFLVAATRMGGLHGYDERGALEPLCGAIAGFAKAYQREKAETLVKVVDIVPTQKARAVADMLIDETLRDPGAVEIGRHDGDRFAIGLADSPAIDGGRGLELDADSVYVITGAAGSIVSTIVGDLATTGGVFYLIDLTPAPKPGDPDIVAFDADRDGLRRTIGQRLEAASERPTPVKIDRALAVIERLAAAQTAIDAVERAGGTAHYRSVDLTDADAVAAVMDEVRERHGRVDVLMHAAGLEISRRLPDKSPREFDLVFDVKVDGWFNLLRGLGDAPIGATVAFGSIAGRFGNSGQADYAAANDLLCKFATHFRSARPQTRGIAIDWTAWGEIGMAARGSIPAIMARAGIDMLPTAAGVPVVRRELTAGAITGEVLVAGRLGAMLDELDATGGLDPEAVPMAADDRLGPMIGRVTGMPLHTGLEVEITLDPEAQPFLCDHRISGTAVLPGVMGLEAFAEVSRLLFPAWHIAAVEDASFLAPLKFYKGQPRALTVRARLRRVGDDLWADCALLGSRILHGQTEITVTTHFTAGVRLSKTPLEAAATAEPPSVPGNRVGEVGDVVEAADIYQIYFHGPAYRVLDRAWRQGPGIVGRLRADLPADREPPDRPVALAPRLIELCFQTAGVFEIGTTGAMGLPHRVDRVRVFGDIESAQGRVHAIVTPDESAPGAFDADVVDDAGRVLVDLRGYRTEILGPVDDMLRTPLARVFGG